MMFTSFPLVSPRSNHSTVTLRVVALMPETTAEWIRPGRRNKTMKSLRSNFLRGGVPTHWWVTFDHPNAQKRYTELVDAGLTPTYHLSVGCLRSDPLSKSRENRPYRSGLPAASNGEMVTGKTQRKATTWPEHQLGYRFCCCPKTIRWLVTNRPISRTNDGFRAASLL